MRIVLVDRIFAPMSEEAHLCGIPGIGGIAPSRPVLARSVGDQTPRRTDARTGSSGEALVMTPAVSEVSAWEYFFTCGGLARRSISAPCSWETNGLFG